MHGNKILHVEGDWEYTGNYHITYHLDLLWRPTST